MPSSIEIELLLKDSRYQAALVNVRKSLNSLHSSLQVAARSARNVLLIGGGALAFFVKTASDFEETSSKFDAVFKGQSAAVRDWVGDLSKELQRSEVDLLAYMARLQDTFVPMGFARDEATKLSKELTKLGIDLASFNNIADDEVINALTSALVGNHEAVRQFGISITAASLDIELLSQGFPKITKGATAQQKALARLALMVKSTADAQGDASRTAESFENQMKGLKASFITTSQVIGDVFIPTLKTFIAAIIPALETTAQWIKDNKQLVLTVTGVIGAISAMLVVLPLLTGSLLLLLSSIKAVGVALVFVAGNPITLIIAGLAAIALAAFAADAALAIMEARLITLGQIDTFGRLQNDMSAARIETKALIAEMDAITDQDIDTETLAIAAAYERWERAAKAALKEAERLGRSQRDLENYKRQVAEAAEGVKNWGGEAKIINEERKAASALATQQATEEEKLNKIIKKAEEVLRVRVDTYGQDALAKQRSKLAAEGATDKELALFDSLQGQVRVLDEIAKKRKTAEDARKSQKDAAKSLIASLRTQEQIVVEKEKEFEAMFALGDITEDQLAQAKESLKIKKAEQALSFSSFQAAINRIQGASFKRDERFQGQKSDSKSKKTATTVAVEKQTGEIKILGKSVKDIGQAIVDAFNPEGVFGS